MAGREVAYSGGAKKLNISSHDQPLDSIFTSAPSNSFLGSRAMFNFGAIDGVDGSRIPFYQSFDPQENGDEYYDDYFNQPEKKRRLSLDQVQFLEKSFEVENKLEPERKTQLANELGLQPRQIAVWFQNRRARWKTKHLETEYETLHAGYKTLKTDYESLLKENEKLKAQVCHLKHNGLTQDVDNVNTRICDTKELSEAMPREVSADMISISKDSKLAATTSKNDDQSSARCDVWNADSPRLLDGIHPLLLKSGESSHVFEPDHTDSLNEELSQRSSVFPKIVDDAYCQPYANSCSHGFSVDDHAFSFWSY